MNCSFDGKGVKRSRWKEEINKNIYIGKHIQKTPNKNIQTSERKKHITRSINYEKKFSFGKIQHDIHWEEFAPLSVTSGNLSNEYCESEKNLTYTSFQVLTKTHTRFTKFSLESRRTRASISLECKSSHASCVILALGTLITSVLKERKKKKYRLIDYKKICISINCCF